MLIEIKMIINDQNSWEAQLISQTILQVQNQLAEAQLKFYNLVEKHLRIKLVLIQHLLFKHHLYFGKSTSCRQKWFKISCKHCFPYHPNTPLYMFATIFGPFLHILTLQFPIINAKCIREAICEEYLFKANFFSLKFIYQDF